MNKKRILDILRRKRLVIGTVSGIIGLSAIVGGIGVYKHIQNNKILSDANVGENKAVLSNNESDKNKQVAEKVIDNNNSKEVKSKDEAKKENKEISSNENKKENKNDIDRKSESVKTEAKKENKEPVKEVSNEPLKENENNKSVEKAQVKTGNNKSREISSKAKDVKSSEKSTKSIENNRIEKAREIAKSYIGNKNVGVYCMDLKTGKTFGINQNKMYYSASVGKLPGILYTQRQLNNGIINNNTQFVYHDYVNNIQGAMIRGGSGVLQNQVHDGSKVSVKTLLKDTCEHSDNLASNMLGYYVCDKNGEKFKNYIGNIIGRHISTFKKEFSARETALLMKGIYNQGGEAINYLANTDYDDIKIPKYIPVKVAHKIGINGEYNHDVAIVYGKNPYIISIMTKGASDEFIANLSKKIYNEMKY